MMVVRAMLGVCCNDTAERYCVCLKCYRCEHFMGAVQGVTWGGRVLHAVRTCLICPRALLLPAHAASRNRTCMKDAVQCRIRDGLGPFVDKGLWCHQHVSTIQN
jgi:hypothetical protein